MQPDQDDNQRNVNVPARPNAGTVQTPDRDAAARLMRQQIENIYDDSSSHQQTNTYKQTHDSHVDHTVSSANTENGGDWKQYHSAWQNYYQQYYERYYMAQLARRQDTIQPQIAPKSEPAEKQTTNPSPVSEDQAVHELRTKLIGEVKERSKTVRKSRHFMPAVAALTVALVFGFLQYNQLIVAQVKAYVSPGAIDAQNIVIDPTASTKVGPEPKIIIPKINVEAPVVYDVPSLEESVVQNKLRDGVVHYPIPGASSLPGEKGNTVILGHSSNDVFDNGAYKFVFVQLEKLNIGDTFYLHHNGTRYTYSIKEKKVILPTEVDQLVIDSPTPLATLVTCTPAGTALKRLVVIAEQISPDPSKAADAAVDSTPVQPGNIAGDSPTLFERLFGIN